MKKVIYRIFKYWKLIFSIIFSKKRKCFVLCHPVHANLGDQAQLMCTDRWIKDNFPNCKIVHLGTFILTINFPPYSKLFISTCSTLITLFVLKIVVRKTDLFIGHSGYFMIDHHNGWKMFTDIMYYFPNNKMIIFPQTINFYNPLIKKLVADKWNRHKNLTLLCRDEVSYKNACEMFPSIQLLLYPDIVTSLIGTRIYKKNREGILFCMRNDIESFYKVDDIDVLMNRFGQIRKERVDTTLSISQKEMDVRREQLINNMIEKISTYKVVITDRYHGTIFSVIASTPVIVLSSADHKLSSGVKWFPKEIFNEYISYAQDLDEAYELAVNILNRDNLTYNNPPYFKEKYWDVLKSLL